MTDKNIRKELEQKVEEHEVQTTAEKLIIVNEKLRKEIAERKRGEEVLRKYKLIVSSSSDHLALLDKNYVYQMVNDAYLIAQNKRLEDIVGHSVPELFGQEFFEKNQKPHIDRCLAGEIVRYQLWVNFPALGRRYVEIIHYPYYEENGSISGYVVNARDVTDRKQVEEKLRYERDLIERIMETSPAGIVHVDTHGRVIYGNKRAEEILGIQFSKATVRTYNDPEWKITDIDGGLLPEEDLPFNILKRTGKPVSGIQHAIQWPDGKRVFLSINSAPLFDVSGTFEGMVSTIEDITKRKLDEQVLKESEERFRVLVEQSPLGLSLLDEEGNYKYLSPGFVEMFGFTNDQIATGRDWFRKAFPNKEYRHHVISTWIKDKQDYGVGEPRHRNFVVTCKDGSTKEIHFRPVTLVNKDQLIIYEDITEKNRIETQLQQAQKMEAIGTLAGGIAHDFNNILTPFIVNIEMAMMDIPEGYPVQSYLKEALRAGYRARDLVKQILAFSRQKETELKPLEVGIIIKEALKLLRASIPTTIEIQQKLAAESNLVLADPTQIHQIIMNLCTNAAHAMSEKGGMLVVTTVNQMIDQNEITESRDLKPGKYLKLTVSDTGHGMTPEVLKRIFEPYFTTKGPGKGTGLGLAVVHGIVKSYGGEISVESEPGKGTTFHVWLPNVESAVLPEKELKTVIPHGTERLLLVDDEWTIVSALQKMLVKLNYHVTTRTSSIEALEAFRNRPDKFDLVITDMTMPNMTGKELARELISIRPDIPIILCTGFSEMIDEKMAKEMGIRAFIMKPIVIKEMAQTVRKVLEAAKGKT